VELSPENGAHLRGAVSNDVAESIARVVVAKPTLSSVEIIVARIDLGGAP
jgi:hypothetical protein